MAEGASDPLPSASAVRTGLDTAREKPKQIRRRNRTIASCLPCRQRKIRCDKSSPCGNCKKFSRNCLYIAPALDTVAQQELAQLKDKLSSLEESLGRDIIRRTYRSDGLQLESSREPRQNDVQDDDSLEPEDEKGLKPTPLASFEAIYDDDADDELMDLGIQMGKMRISERAGGFVRPKLADELHACVRDSGQEKPRERRNVFRQAYAYDALSDSWQPTPVRPESYLGPGPNYIAPSSSFFFPEVSSSTNEFLPPRNVSDQLVAQYLLAAHPLARVVHRPTFEKQYVLFWNSFTNGVSPPAPIQAVIFAALFSAAVSLTDPIAQRLAGMPRAMLVDRLRTTTEMSLSRARFLQTAKLDTLQAFVMYMLPLCRDDVSRAHSSLVGAAIRLAQCMGFHKDGTSYNFTAVDTHVRRLIWYQLIYLDVRTCEATGPRPQIRKDEYDTEFPLNVNDEDLLSQSPPTEDSPMWTEMTLTKMKFECYDVIRQLWDDMPQIDRKKTTLTSVLGKIQRFRASTGAKYVALMQGTMPLQVLGRNIYRMLSNRCFLIVLQRYAVSPLVHPMPQMPERLRQILVEAATSATESGVAFDTHPLLKTWSWYRPALLQYHGCLLMLLEVYERPDIPEAPRIWACVDYVFELRSDLSPVEKAEGVLLELSNRLGVYHNMRKMKLATSIDDQSSANNSIGPVEDNTRQLTRLQQAASEQMEAISHGSPLDGLGSHSGTNVSQEDSAMHAMTDIDWNEWEKHFPTGSQSVLGNVDVPADFEMASFNPHDSYTRIQDRNASR